tara:strand:+ start:770 stop:1633 length:864 start_codon:yes stop_codon:yes gene_type:complete
MKILPPIKLPSDHNIFHFGDLHEGSILFSEHVWGQFVRAINSPYDGCSNNYAISGGDLMEAIMIDDKRFSQEKLTEPLPLEQKKRTEERLMPIKDKLLCLLDGNHERKLWRFGNIIEDIALNLGVPYGTYTAKLTIVDGRNKLMYKIYETHGIRSITSTADDPKRRRVNMELILKRHLRDMAADCAVMIKHHVHQMLVCRPVEALYLYDDGRQIRQGYTGWGQNAQFIHPDARWYGCAGSFMRLFGDGVSGYAEIFEYKPTELGWLVLRVRNKQVVSLDQCAALGTK